MRYEGPVAIYQGDLLLADNVHSWLFAENDPAGGFGEIEGIVSERLPGTYPLIIENVTLRVPVKGKQRAFRLLCALRYDMNREEYEIWPRGQIVFEL